MYALRVYVSFEPFVQRCISQTLRLLLCVHASHVDTDSYRKAEAVHRRCM
jgi:hypothetical protein